MPKKAPGIVIEEISGDQFSDLKTAQDSALPRLSDNLQSVIQDLLERGILINDRGQIIPKPTRTKNDEG